MPYSPSGCQILSNTIKCSQSMPTTPQKSPKNRSNIQKFDRLHKFMGRQDTKIQRWVHENDKKNKQNDDSKIEGVRDSLSILSKLHILGQKMVEDQKNYNETKTTAHEKVRTSSQYGTKLTNRTLRSKMTTGRGYKQSTEMTESRAGDFKSLKDLQEYEEGQQYKVSRFESGLNIHKVNRTRKMRILSSRLTTNGPEFNQTTKFQRPRKLQINT